MLVTVVVGWFGVLRLCDPYPNERGRGALICFFGGRGVWCADCCASSDGCLKILDTIHKAESTPISTGSRAARCRPHDPAP